MDSECAFCGRADAAYLSVSCEDCQAEHRVCPECAADAAELAQELASQAA